MVFTYVHKPGRVWNLFPVELDVDSVSAEVVGDEAGRELLLGDGGDVRGHSAALDDHLQVAEASAGPVNYKKNKKHSFQLYNLARTVKKSTFWKEKVLRMNGSSSQASSLPNLIF